MAWPDSNYPITKSTYQVGNIIPNHSTRMKWNSSEFFNHQGCCSKQTCHFEHAIVKWFSYLELRAPELLLSVLVSSVRLEDVDLFEPTTWKQQLIVMFAAKRNLSPGYDKRMRIKVFKGRKVLLAHSASQSVEPRTDTNNSNETRLMATMMRYIVVRDTDHR